MHITAHIPDQREPADRAADRAAAHDWITKIGRVNRAQDDTQLARLALQHRRHDLHGKQGAEQEIAHLDVLIADNYTSQVDLRIALAAATDVDLSTLDGNGLTTGLDWVRVGGPSPQLPDNPRWWATARQLAAEEYAATELAGGAHR